MFNSVDSNDRERQIVFGRKKHPTSPLLHLPFSKTLLKLNLCEGSEIFSYCLSFSLHFFLAYFWTVARMGNRLLNTEKKAVLKVLPCHLKARNAVNLELTCS